MNLEEELKKATKIENIKENKFPKTPPFPYIVYAIRMNARGADNVNNLNDNTIAIALYDNKINKIIEQKIEKWLDKLGIDYDKDREWQDEEKCYETYYEFNKLEKKEEC